MNGRFLKTMTILLCALVLLLAAAPAYAVSQAEYDISQLQQPTAALDLVILLDNSGSMYVDTGGNDVESFRYDAASIMLNMCEAQGTKAAARRPRLHDEEETARTGDVRGRAHAGIE